jgi:hypothetical protein
MSHQFRQHEGVTVNNSNAGVSGCVGFGGFWCNIKGGVFLKKKPGKTRDVLNSKYLKMGGPETPETCNLGSTFWFDKKPEWLTAIGENGEWKLKRCLKRT